MGWSLNIGTIAGTAVRVHVTFLLFLAWIFMSGYVEGGAAAASGSLIFVLLLFGCVLAHEFGHIFMARGFGIPTPDVTMLPIGGLARLQRIPEEPHAEFLVAIAGPLVNVAITFALVTFAGAHFNLQSLLTIGDHASLADRLAAVNVVLAVFNMIPAFPMDGGRVLRALLATRMGHVRATQIAAHIGQGLACALGLLGLFGNPMLLLIAVFVFFAAGAEARMVARRAWPWGRPAQV